MPDVLAEYGAHARAQFPRYLPKGQPQRHLYDLIADYPNRGGKMMRPAMCIASACALGGRLEDVLPVAVSIELLHNALLIHDDIEDESDLRRGRPTLHKLHGTALALNAGDTLALLSLRPLLDHAERLGPELALQLIEEAEHAAIETAEGQAIELGWQQDDLAAPSSTAPRTSGVIDERAYLDMVLKKTCWLATIYPIRAGALIATGGAIATDAFVTFGYLLGAAFQIQDDLLNLSADAAYGKERNGDLWEGKRTLPLIRLLNEATREERERIRACLRTARPRKRRADVAWIRRKLDSYGCIDFARQYAQGIAGAALEEFHVAFAGVRDSRDRRFLEGLATWVFERS